jgi:hypothetical protein
MCCVSSHKLLTGGGPPALGLGGGANNPTVKTLNCYEMFYTGSEEDGFFGTTKEPENGRKNQGEWGGRSMWHAWDKTVKCRRFWWKSPRERVHSEDRGVDGRTFGHCATKEFIAIKPVVRLAKGSFPSTTESPCWKLLAGSTPWKHYTVLFYSRDWKLCTSRK